MDEFPVARDAPESHENPSLPAPTPRRFIVTPTLVAMNIAYFLAMVSVGVPAVNPQAPDVVPFGANFGALTVNGEWWRLLSSTFIHFGFLHLGFNMWCLWALGNLAERLFGNGRFLVVYLLSALGGSTASLIWHPYVVSAGASGAVFGLAGALATFLYFAHIQLPKQATRQLLTSIMIFIGFNLAFGFTVPGIDNAGHLGGLVVGALLGAALAYRSVFTWSAAAVAVLFLASLPVAKSVASANPIVMLTAADLLRAEGDTPGVVAKLEETVSKHPDFAPGHEALAFVYFQDDQYEKAVDSARRAVELDPELERARYVLGSALYEIEAYEAAVSELQTLIEQEAGIPAAYVYSSRSLRALGREDEAMEALEEGLKIAHTTTALFGQIGFDSLSEVELEFAAKSLREEIAITPEEPENYNVLSLVLAKTGAHDEALEAVKTALELQPNAPHITDSLGTVRLYRGELAEAIDAYREAIALDPDYPVYHYNLSLALRRRGDIGEADAALAQARRLAPNLDPPPDGQPIM